MKRKLLVSVAMVMLLAVGVVFMSSQKKDLESMLVLENVEAMVQTEGTPSGFSGSCENIKNDCTLFCPGCNQASYIDKPGPVKSASGTCNKCGHSM